MASEGAQVLRHSGYLLLARLFARLASIPFLLYAAATLGPSLFGIFTFTLATVEMLSALGDFGLSRYGARELVRAGESGLSSGVGETASPGGTQAGRSAQARLAGIILVLQIVISIILTVPALAAILALSGPPKRDVLLLGLAAAFISSFVFTTDTIFTATRRFGASALLSVAGRVVYLAAGFAALAAGYSVIAVMLAFLLGMVVESALRIFYTAASVTGFSLDFSAGQAWRVLARTAPFALSAVATLVYFRADTLILELLKGDLDVGIYNAAYSFFSFFVWAPIILTRTLLPGMTRRFALEPAEAARMNRAWFRLAGGVGVVAAMLMTLLAGPLINTLMPQYGDAVVVLQILMWSIPPLMMVSIGFNALVVTDHETAAAHTTVATAVLIVALDFSLIPAYGPRGAALAMVITTFLWLGMVWGLMRRELPR